MSSSSAFHFNDLSSLAASNMFTWEAGIAVLLLISLLNFVSHHVGKNTNSKDAGNAAVTSSSASKENGEKPAIKPQATFLYEAYPKLNEPNFGYKDVKVSKLLVHPIKVSCVLESFSRLDFDCSMC